MGLATADTVEILTLTLVQITTVCIKVKISPVLDAVRTVSYSL